MLGEKETNIILLEQQQRKEQFFSSISPFPPSRSSLTAPLSPPVVNMKKMKKKKKTKTEEHTCSVFNFLVRAAFLRRGGSRHLLLHHHPHHQSYRRRVIHILPLLPILSLLLLVALFSFFSPPIISSSTHLDHLHHHYGFLSDGGDNERNAEQETGGVSLRRHLWSTSSSEFYRGCSNASSDFMTADVKTEPDRYLLISTSGGLNQQRTGITDAVVAAYILNATLVVPMLDQRSYWKDASDFEDIFDVDWFISFLSEDVRIIKQLPPINGKVVTPVHTRVPRKCHPKCYLDRILPLLEKKHAVRLTKFDYRLSNNLDTDLQKLRCRVNYHALKYTDPITDMGRKLVKRMKMKSRHFIALHLRFEPDMLAFSGCHYGGGEKERRELGAIRKRWKTLHNLNPDKQRRQGRCPLTPEEVGLMLRALGYDSDVHIYVASGEVYGGEETLAPLKAMFPNFHSKDTLASEEELAAFTSYSARMAALDFIVADESDVFVTNNNGNMARILAGRRRYYGHKPTIRPNTKKMSRLFMNSSSMTWEEFSSKVRTSQVGFMGEPNEVKPGQGEFHENPRSCICDNANEHSTHYDRGGGMVDNPSSEEEQEMPDPEYLDNESEVQQEKGLPDTGSVLLAEDP